MKNIYSIILAAGKGTRMKSGLPKVLHKICGQPMIHYSLETLKKLNLKIVIVVGYKKEKIVEACGDKYIYAEQKEQLGTAHAVISAKSKIPKEVKTVLILNGDDSAFYRPQTLQKLIDIHLKNKNTITLLSLNLDDPEGFGRIKKDSSGKILGIVEEKNASQEEKKIKEINLGTYCFDANFLWNNLSKISKNKISGEYYLTDLITLAISQNKKIQTVLLENPKEWIGINTPEQLAKANQIMHNDRTSKDSSFNYQKK